MCFGTCIITMSSDDKRQGNLEGTVRESSPASRIATPSRIVTRGSVRRAFRGLVGGGYDRRDPERTDEELLLAWDNVAHACGKYVHLHTDKETIGGTFRRPSYPRFGCQFLYYCRGKVIAREYSQEDVVLKGMTLNDDRAIYIFEEQYPQDARVMLHGLDALVAKYHIWRAGIRGPDSIISSGTR